MIVDRDQVSSKNVGASVPLVSRSGHPYLEEIAAWLLVVSLVSLL